MKKFFIVLTGFLIGAIFFLPKQNIYYFVQQKLAENKIHIISEINSNPLKLSLSNGKIYYKNMEIATFKNADVYLFLVYNKAEIKDIKLKLGSYFVSFATLTYTVVSPFEIIIKAKGNFADMSGTVNLKEKYVKLYFNNIKNPSIKRMLKKDKKGYYYYAKY